MMAASQPFFCLKRWTCCDGGVSALGAFILSSPLLRVDLHPFRPPGPNTSETLPSSPHPLRFSTLSRLASPSPDPSAALGTRARAVLGIFSDDF